jgi:hypothetical protein
VELLPRRAITWREHAVPGVQRRVVVDADEVQPVAQRPPILRREGRQPGAQEPAHLRRVVSVDYRVKKPAASDKIGWLVCNALGGLWTVRAGRPCALPWNVEGQRPLSRQPVRRRVRQRHEPDSGHHDADQALLLALQVFNNRPRNRTRSERTTTTTTEQPSNDQPEHDRRCRTGVVPYYLVLGLVDLDGGGVGQDDVVRGDVGLGVGVAPGAGARASPRRVGAEHVAPGDRDVGLVEGGPVPDAVAERREAHVRQVAEVAPRLGAAEPRPVPVLQLLRDVVVGQRHERLYPCAGRPIKSQARDEKVRAWLATMG